MSRKSATVTATMDLSPLRAFLKTQASDFDTFLTKLQKSARGAEINQDELYAICVDHSEDITNRSNRAFPSPSLSSLQSPFASYVATRNSHATPSSRSPEKKKSTVKKRPGLILYDRDDETDDALNGSSPKSYDYSFGSFVPGFGESSNSRAIRGGANKLFSASRSGSKFHTPSKTKRNELSSVTIIDSDNSDSEDQESSEDGEDTLFVDDGEKKRSGTRFKKKSSQAAVGEGWMSAQDFSDDRFGAAMKRTKKFLKKVEGKKDKKKKKNGSGSRKLETGSSSKKRRFTKRNRSDGNEDEDDEDSDISPTKKRKSKRKSSSQSSIDQKSGQKRERQRDASFTDMGRKKAVDRFLNSHKTFTKSTENTGPIEISSDDDENIIAHHRPSFNPSESRVDGGGNVGSSYSNGKTFISPKDYDKKIGLKDNDDPSPNISPTPSRNPRVVPGSTPLPDHVVGGFEAFRTGAGLGGAAAMESVISLGDVDGEVSEAYDDDDDIYGE